VQETVGRAGAWQTALRLGLRKGVSGYLWMLKILLPVSLATTLLECSGWLAGLDGLLGPVMGVIGLPSQAALPILAGLMAGIYACIAAMSVLPLSPEQMTIVTVFILIAHSLPQEAAIQARSGIHFVKSTGVRLCAALAASVVVAWILQPGAGAQPAWGAALSPAALALGPVLLKWGMETLRLCLKILVIIVAVMILIELVKAYRLVDRCAVLLAPVLKIMGLDRRAGLLWLTGALFGLVYGGAVIVEQSRELGLGREEIEKLQLSIGINHAVIEDSLLFLPFVVSPVYVWLPRLAAAIAVVYLVALQHKLRHSS
jgi:Fe2+ transport system protein B